MPNTYLNTHPLRKSTEREQKKEIFAQMKGKGGTGWPGSLPQDLPLKQLGSSRLSDDDSRLTPVIGGLAHSLSNSRLKETER